MISGIKRLGAGFAKACAVLGAGVTIGASGNALAIVSDPSGASIQASVSGDFLIGCTGAGCGHIPLIMSGTPEQNVGGPGFASASASYSGVPLGIPDYTVGGGATYAALANFSGLSATPVLKALATAENVQAFAIGNPSPAGIDTFNTFVQAQGIQRYTFIGTTDTTYTFNFRVDGSLRTSQASFSANASFHDANDPFLETNIGSGGTFAFGEGVDQTTPFDRTFAVQVTFQPGAAYFMRTQLSVGTAYDFASTSVSANAYNTFLVTSITGADPNLLVAGIAPVPEPQAYAMLALGLVVIGVARRRREATADRPAVALA